MTNFQLSTPVYITGAIVGAVMVLTSIVVLFVQPADVAQMAQNNVARVMVVTPTPNVVIWLDANGNYQVAVATPTPCLVSSYVVTADSCK